MKTNEQPVIERIRELECRQQGLKAELEKTKWPRCDDCNFELVDLGEGFGLKCEYCILKDQLAAETARADRHAEAYVRLAEAEEELKLEIERLKAELAAETARANRHVEAYTRLAEAAEKLKLKLTQREAEIAKLRTANDELRRDIIDLSEQHAEYAIAKHNEIVELRRNHEDLARHHAELHSEIMELRQKLQPKQ